MRTMASIHIMKSVWSLSLFLLLGIPTLAAPSNTEGRQSQEVLDTEYSNPSHGALTKHIADDVHSSDERSDDVPHHTISGDASHREHSRSSYDLRLHDLRRIVHLRDRLDRLHLQQRTDRLRLDNLERILLEMLEQQRRKEQPSSGLNSRSDNASDKSLSSKHPRDSLTIPVMAFAKDDSASLGHHGYAQNVNDETSLKIPSSGIKTGQTAEIASLSDVPGLTSAEENQHKTVLWLREEVNSLQELVQDLGKSCNVTVAMHDKQEMEARLGGLGEGLAILQGGLSRASAHGEATEALLNTLREEGRNTAQEVQKAASRLADVEREMASLKENLYDTLASLPDGSLTSQNTPDTMIEVELGRIWTNNDTTSRSDGPKHVTKRLSFPVGTSSLRVGLSGVQQSSLQLLQAVDALETRQDTDREQLRREIAKLEFNMSETIEEHHEELRRYHDGINTELNLSADLRRLAEGVETMKKDLLERNAKQSDANYRFESFATRFLEFENRVKSVIGEFSENQVPSDGARSDQSSPSLEGSSQLARQTHRHRGSQRRHPRVRGERY